MTKPTIVIEIQDGMLYSVYGNLNLTYFVVTRELPAELAPLGPYTVSQVAANLEPLYRRQSWQTPAELYEP
jgi:hypothetical protein